MIQVYAVYLIFSIPFNLVGAGRLSCRNQRDDFLSPQIIDA